MAGAVGRCLGLDLFLVTRPAQPFSHGPSLESLREQLSLLP